MPLHSESTVPWTTPHGDEPRAGSPLLHSAKGAVPIAGLNRRRALLLLSIATVCAIVAPVAWRKYFGPEFFPRNFAVVKDKAIYRSAQNSPRVLRQLQRDYRIKTILDLGGARGYDERTQAQRDVAAELGIERHEFLLPSDGTGDPATYVQVLLYMTDPARQPMLVHCGSGAQRTSTAVILYRTIVEGQSIKQAYAESFAYGHKPDEWVLLAYLAENFERIRNDFEAAQHTRDEKTESLAPPAGPHG